MDCIFVDKRSCSSGNNTVDDAKDGQEQFVPVNGESERMWGEIAKLSSIVSITNSEKASCLKNW